MTKTKKMIPIMILAMMKDSFERSITDTCGGINDNGGASEKDNLKNRVISTGEKHFTSKSNKGLHKGTQQHVKGLLL